MQNHSRQVVPGLDVILFILEAQDFNEFVIIIIYYCKLDYVTLRLPYHNEPDYNTHNPSYTREWKISKNQISKYDFLANTKEIWLTCHESHENVTRHKTRAVHVKNFAWEKVASWLGQQSGCRTCEFPLWCFYFYICEKKLKSPFLTTLFQWEMRITNSWI